MPRYFTLEEANRALPDVEQTVRRLRRVRDEATALREQLERQWAALERDAAPLSEIADAQQRLDALQEEFGDLVGRLEARGVILRDLDMGLVDFPTVAGHAEVYLCWRLGESSIAFWHGLGEGYAGRKPLALLPGRGAH
jgi:hypothetical protein